LVSSLRQVYQLKVQLKGIRLPIWRRILIADVAPLDVFHHAVQISMGWTNSHLHQFIDGKRRYGLVDPEYGMDWDDDLLDESNFKVKDLFSEVGDSVLYEYDFGDGWLHQIKLEKITPFEANQLLPVCIKGKRACPPEDVGGVPGYLDFLEKWQDESDPEHDDILEWAGEYFLGPEEFDQEEANEILREFFGSV